MEVAEVLKIKSNIFDHILYEFEMYLETYKVLHNLASNNSNDILMKNVLLESHSVHLRNLIEFFGCEKNCISTMTIFNVNPNLGYTTPAVPVKKMINKLIEHLTKERYEWYRTQNDLACYGDAICKMYNTLVPCILKCVTLLYNKNDIKLEFSNDLQDKFIQARLLNLTNICRA